MKEVINILKKKKLQFFFLFYILLLLPMLSPMAENLSAIDKILIFIVCGLLFSSILVLSTFFSSRVEKIVYSILLIISIIPGAIFLSYLLFAHVLLEQNSVTSLFETNPNESKEFVANYLSIWVIMGVLVYTTIPVVMISKMKKSKPLNISNHKSVFIGAFLVLISIIAINELSRSVYFINFYKTFVKYKIHLNYEIKTIRERQNLDIPVTILETDSIPKTIVVVIGESLNKHHMSLYGYERDTNPFLKQQIDSSLYVYNDIVSPQVHTIPVMRSLLTMSDRQNPEYFTEHPSLFELFNRAGFDTYLISNQGFSEECRSSYDVLLNLAKTKIDLSQYKQHDDVVIDALNEILKKESDKNRFILIHLIGNHMAYEFRYPKQYIVFDHKKDNLLADNSFRDNENTKKTIDKYDNSVLYNDFIINSVINSLKKNTDSQTAMIYFSDHAEEMYDYREFAGHAYEKVSPTMCQVPFMLWMSDKYKEKHPKIVIETDRAYSTEDFIYSISDIANLRYVGYDDSRSIFSPNFNVRDRFVGDKNYLDIKAKFEN